MRWEPHVRFGGGCEETISRKADMAPRSRPHHPDTTGFSHRARSSGDRSVRRWIRVRRSSTPLAFSASGLIAGRNPVNARPLLVPRAPRARNVYPRKVTEVCSCSPRRRPSSQ